MVEMVGDDMFAAPRNEDELFDPGLAGLFHGILDDRLVDHGQHFLGDGLGGGQKTGAHSGNRKNGFSDRFWGGHAFSGGWFSNTLFHRMAPLLLSSFRHLTGTMGKRTAVCIWMALVLTGIACFGTAVAAPATPALIAEVLAALDKGDAQTAARLADAALGEAGVGAAEQGSLLLYRGLARELMGQSDSALDDFTQALHTNTLPPDEREQVLLQRGFLRDALGRPTEAIGDYSSVIALKGLSAATALNNRANIYRRQNNLKQARRDYLAALSAGGVRAQYSYYGLGQIAEAQHDVKAARDFYIKAAIVDPDYAAAAERLTALGAPPTGVVLAPEEKIILRPPRSGGLAPRPLRTVNFAAQRFVSVKQLALRPALDQRDPAPSRPSGGLIQLGAWRSAAEAGAGWASAKAQAGEMLDGLNPQVSIADLPKGRFFRLRVGLRAGQSGARVCAGLTAKGMACLPVPH
jgi:tetratricopeptide (TPR) repeat protein